MKSITYLLFVAILILVATPVQAIVQYNVTDIGWHPLYSTSSNTLPSDINDSGKIVGTSNRVGSDNCRAYLYSQGSMTNLGMLSNYTYSCSATAINNSGVIVGYSNKYPTYGGQVRGFVYYNGSMTALGTLGGTNSQALAINDIGQITGTSSILNNTENHAFIYKDGSFKDIGTLGGTYSSGNSINNNGQVVGYARTSNSESHAFIYSNGQMNDLGTLGGTDSDAQCINDNGQVVGFSYLTRDVSYHAFLYKNGKMTDLGTLGGAYSAAYCINSKEQIVGFSQVPGNIAHAYLYDDGAMMDLNNLIDPALGLTLHGATAINESGQIVAYGEFYGKNNNHAFLLTPVPEPSTFLLLGFCALGLLASKRFF